MHEIGMIFLKDIIGNVQMTSEYPIERGREKKEKEIEWNAIRDNEIMCIITHHSSIHWHCYKLCARYKKSKL